MEQVFNQIKMEDTTCHRGTINNKRLSDSRLFLTVEVMLSPFIQQGNTLFHQVHHCVFTYHIGAAPEVGEGFVTIHCSSYH